MPLRAPSNIESTVTLTIPAPIGRARSRVLSASLHAIARYGSDRADAARAASTPTSTGPCSGKGSSLFRDAEGGFSLAQARALEACHRAGVEVVIMSGRREPQVHEAARLMGQASYIYEAGCAFAIEGETTLMTGEMAPNEDGTIYEQIEQRGIPKLLFEHFEGRLEYHSPWHHGRVLSHLFRGKVDVEEANALLQRARRRRPAAARQRRDRPADADGRGPHPRLPPGPAGRSARRRRSPATPAPAATTRRECIAVGDSVEDLEVAAAVGRFFVVANGPEHDAGLRAALPDWDNVTVTEGSMGDGFYEAVVSSADGAPLSA